MPFYKYTAHDKLANKGVSGSLEAPNQMEAIAEIKKLGYLPISVQEARPVSHNQSSNNFYDRRDWLEMFTAFLLALIFFSFLILGIHWAWEFTLFIWNHT